MQEPTKHKCFSDYFSLWSISRALKWLLCHFCPVLQLCGLQICSLTQPQSSPVSITHFFKHCFQGFHFLSHCTSSLVILSLAFWLCLICCLIYTLHFISGVLFSPLVVQLSSFFFSPFLTSACLLLMAPLLQAHPVFLPICYTRLCCIFHLIIPGVLGVVSANSALTGLPYML